MCLVLTCPARYLPQTISCAVIVDALSLVSMVPRRTLISPRAHTFVNFAFVLLLVSFFDDMLFGV
jgi:hypothetical protein